MTAQTCEALFSLLLACVSLNAGLGAPAQSSQTGKVEDRKSKTEGQENRKIYTNEDLIQLRDKQQKGLSPSLSSGSASPSSETTKPKKVDDKMSLSAYRDLNGHDRDYWRKKVTPLRSQVDSLNSQIHSLKEKQSKVGPAGGLRVSKSGRLHTSSKDNRQELSERLAELERKRGLVLKSIQDLEDEARKAQALPEWLR
jgi:hypothetical protein